MKDLGNQSFSSQNNSINSNSTKQMNSNKFESDFKKNDIEHKKYTLLMFEKLLNNKNKFTLDDHFDKNNQKKVLNEKDEYLSEMIFEDDIPLNNNEIENKITKKELDIIMPGSPHKFTFGQN